MNWSNLKQPKEPRHPQHVAFVRELPCCKCGSSWGIIEHHLLRTKKHLHGISKRVPDTKIVSLCGGCHTELHDVIGDERKFFGGKNTEQLADALFNVTGDLQAGTKLVYEFMKTYKGK